MSDLDGYALGRRLRGYTPAAPDLGHEQPDWVIAAACQFTDPDLFHPEKGGTTIPAKTVCAGCPSREACLIFAYEHNERYGVYGGLSERERRRLFDSGWQPGDPTPDVYIRPPVVFCPDCGRGTVSLAGHRAKAHGIRGAA